MTLCAITRFFPHSIDVKCSSMPSISHSHMGFSSRCRCLLSPAKESPYCEHFLLSGWKFSPVHILNILDVKVISPWHTRFFRPWIFSIGEKSKTIKQVSRNFYVICYFGKFFVGNMQTVCSCALFRKVLYWPNMLGHVKNHFFAREFKNIDNKFHVFYICMYEESQIRDVTSIWLFYLVWDISIWEILKVQYFQINMLHVGVIIKIMNICLYEINSSSKEVIQNLVNIFNT